jgi:hypothetical protein
MSERPVPGRQVERTALSWQRTALSVSVLAVVLLAHEIGWGLSAPAQAVTAVLAGLSAVAAGLAAAGASRLPAQGGWWRLRWAVTATILLAVAGLIGALADALGTR